MEITRVAFSVYYVMSLHRCPKQHFEERNCEINCEIANYDLPTEHLKRLKMCNDEDITVYDYCIDFQNIVSLHNDKNGENGKVSFIEIEIEPCLTISKRNCSSASIIDSSFHEFQ